jgi:hypothetical protein
LCGILTGKWIISFECKLYLRASFVLAVQLKSTRVCTSSLCQYFRDKGQSSKATMVR